MGRETRQRDDLFERAVYCQNHGTGQSSATNGGEWIFVEGQEGAGELDKVTKQASAQSHGVLEGNFLNQSEVNVSGNHAARGVRPSNVRLTDRTVGATGR